MWPVLYREGHTVEVSGPTDQSVSRLFRRLDGYNKYLVDRVVLHMVVL